MERKESKLSSKVQNGKFKTWWDELKPLGGRFLLNLFYFEFGLKKTGSAMHRDRQQLVLLCILLAYSLLY